MIENSDSKNSVVELEALLAELESIEDRCARGLLLTSEAGDGLQSVITRTRKALAPGSDAYRNFDRQCSERSLGWSKSMSAYTNTKDSGNFAHVAAALRGSLNLLSPEFLRDARNPKTQFYFSEGDAYRAKLEIWSVMAQATTSIAIVDRYLDADVFRFLESLDASVSIRLLRFEGKPIFDDLAVAFAAGRRNFLARRSAGWHDRFIVVDNAQVWQLGPSFNGIGKDAFTFTLVRDEAARAAFLADFERWWAEGKPVGVP